MPMVIAIDASRLEPHQKTGVEYYSYFLLKELTKIIPENYRVILYSRIPINDVIGDLPYNWENKVLSWPPKYLWTQLRLAFATWRDKPNLLFIPSHIIPFLACGKIVSTIHDISWSQEPKSYSWKSRWYFNFGNWFASLRAAAILTISEYSRRQIVARYSRLQNKIFSIYLAGTILATSEANSPGDYFVILGRVERKKNIIVILEALHKLYKSNPDFKHKLYLIGKPGLGFSEIINKIKLLGLEDKVINYGWLETSEVIKLISGAKALLFPGAVEGFGIPVIDAWNLNVPVVASAGGALPEIIDGAGLVVPPTSVDGWATAINEICQNEKTRLKLIQLAQERRQEFSWHKTAAATWNIFKLVLQTPEGNVINIENHDD